MPILTSALNDKNEAGVVQTLHVFFALKPSKILHSYLRHQNVGISEEHPQTPRKDDFCARNSFDTHEDEEGNEDEDFFTNHVILFLLFRILHSLTST